MVKINFKYIYIVDSENNAEPPEQPERKSFFKSIMSLLPFGPPETKEDLEQEIQDLLEEGEEQGLITSLEERMISSIFDFRETSAVEIMTPVAEVISFDEADNVKDLVDLVFEHGFTRIPLYRENPDRVVGFIHAKDLLKVVMNSVDENPSFEEYLHPVKFISEDTPIVDLLRQFQKNKSHMAMVTDEFGAVRGLITMEDILEEIVGEIDDEYDDNAEDLEKISDGVVLAHARTDIEKIEDFFDVEFPEGVYESIGGLMINLLGRLGKTGDVVESCGLRFEVKSATARHIGNVTITDIREQE